MPACKYLQGLPTDTSTPNSINILMKPHLLNRLRAPLLLLLLAQAPAVAQDIAPAAEVEKILTLDGDSFTKAVRKLSLGYSKAVPALPELWRLMDKLEAVRAARPPRKATDFSSDEWSAYRAVTGAIGEAGGEADYARLLKIYDGLSFESRLHPTFFDVLSEMWIRREMALLQKSPPKVAIAPSVAPLPAEIQGAAPPLAEAWRLYKGATAPFKARFAPSAEAGKQQDAKLDAQQNWPAFYKVIGDFLGGRSKDTVAQMAAFEWGGWCGTGSEQLYGPKHRTLFMALWKQGRYDLALGALMAGADYDRYLLRFRPQKQAWPEQFLAACGVPWEKLYAGATLDGQARTAEMAAYGSEQSARLLEVMAPLPTIVARRDYLQAVAAFVMPPPFSWGPMPEVVAGGRLSSRPAVAPDLQKRLLEILHAQMRPDAGLQTLEDTSDLLKGLRRPESLDVLKSALKMPYNRVRQNASEALQLMGQKVEPLPVAPKVGFRVLLNGQPLKGADLQWEMRAGTQQSVSSGGTTDAEGVLHLERDYLADTQRKITNVVLSSATLKSPAQTWIEVAAPAPANLNARTDITLSTGSLALKAEGFQEGAQTMEVRLHTERLRTYGKYFEAISEWMPLPANRPAVFPALQRGRYRLEARAPGAALWQSQDLTLDKEPLQVTATLQKGADVRFELIAPGGESRDRAPDHALARDGKAISDTYRYYDFLSSTYRGLPAGRYTLKVKPSRERRENARGAATTAPPYEGEERAFTIGEGSPGLIDLGTISLKPAAP